MHPISVEIPADAQIRSYPLRSGSHHRPLRTPFLCLEPPSVFHHARLQPFLDQAHDSLVCYPLLDELHQPFMIDFVEK